MIPSMNSRLESLTPSVIRRYNKLAKETPGCIALTLGEPDAKTDSSITAMVTASLNALETHYIPAAGMDILRTAVSEFEEETHGLHYAPEEILMTNGATEALYLSLTGILNPGDEIVVPAPCLNLYESIAAMSGAKTVYLDTTADAFQLTPAALAGVITEKTKAIVLTSPNNPTGTVYTQESLEAVRAAVAGKGIFVICDDVYNRIVDCDCPMFASYEDLKEQIIVVQSFSKTYAMTGFRMGYLMAPAALVEVLTRLHAAAFLCGISFEQRAGIAALRSDPSELVERFRARRRLVCERLTAMGIEFTAPVGGLYVFPSIRKFGLDSETFCTRMIEEAGVAAVPGTCFGVEGHIRISCSCADEDLAEAMDRMEKFVKGL